MQPILHIDLTTGAIEAREVPAAWRRAYLGGSALAARLLYDHLTADLDPLSPAAPLLILTGPLTGTLGPATGRFVVAGKSPATGLWAESNIGGFWGPELRAAGYDGLLLTGRAPRPTLLWIHGEQVELRDGTALWGLDTYEVQEAARRAVDDPRARVLAIGPAGESGIPFALLLTDHGRVAGRTGLGAVMGAKRLKAIAVRGQGSIPLADPSGYAALRSRVNRALRGDNLTQVMRQLGTAGGADYFDYLGEMPKKYFRAGVFAGAAHISGAAIAESILTGVSACHGCVIACGRVVRLEDGAKRKGPEYETLVGFGPNLLIDDPAAITRLGELCDRYGMDTISMSNTIGLALHLAEQGRITPSEAGGLRLLWGDPALVEELIHLTVRREGFGALLAQGALALARAFDAEDEAVQVHGLEVPYHDPRGASGMALVYATSPRGACHNQSDYFLADIGQVDEGLGLQFFDRHAGAEKAANVARHQDWRTMQNALVMCFFANVPPEDVAALVRAATGEAYTVEDLLTVGERAWNLKRLLNLKLGLRPEEDRLPPPLLEPYAEGGAAGYRIPFEAMLEAYYQARGWDPATGAPTPATLQRLGLEDEQLAVGS